MYYRGSLFRLNDWLHKKLVGMGEWFSGCTITHECLGELFPARKSTSVSGFGLSPKIAPFSPGRCPLVQGPFCVPICFCGWSALTDRERIIYYRSG